MVRKLLKLSSLIVIAVLLVMLTGCPPKITYTLTVDVVGNGTVEQDPDKTSYSDGETVELTAVPDEGWEFSHWSGALTGTQNPKTITMDADKTVVAHFVEEEPPVEEFALTVTVNPAGAGAVELDPDQEDYEEGTVVELTAVPAEGYVFKEWSGDLTGSENPKTITMDADKTVVAHFEEEVEEPDPTVGLEWATNNWFVFEPCEYPAENLIRFTARVGRVSDPEPITSAKYVVEHVASGEGFEVDIDSDDFNSGWLPFTLTRNELMTEIGDPIPGGRYTLTVVAENEYGKTTEKSINFWVKNEPALIDDLMVVENEDDQLVDEWCIITEEGSPITLEATISYDSGITVRVYLVEVEDSDTIANIVAYGQRIFEKRYTTDGPVEEHISITLPDLWSRMDPEVEYKVAVMLFVPECGDPTCLDCGIEDYAFLDCDFVRDIVLDLECLPCDCDPCDPCFDILGWNPGVKILGLDPMNIDYIESVTLTINEVEYEATVGEEDGEIVARVVFGGPSELDPPEVEGEIDLEWKVVTVTGEEYEEICPVEVDFIPPMIDIEIVDCLDEVDETTFSVTFEDGIGLKEGKIWFSKEVETVEFDTEHDSLSAGVYTFELDGLIETISGTLTFNVPAGEGAFVIYAWAEDTWCNTSEASESGIFDILPPRVDFGPECPPCPTCDATGVSIFFGITDKFFSHADIEISHGKLPNGEKTYTIDETYLDVNGEGTLLWDLGPIDCKTVTATITALDECGNYKVKSFSLDIDNVAPRITLFEFDDCIEPEACATETWLTWNIVDNCFEEAYIWINYGELTGLATGTDDNNAVYYKTTDKATEGIHWTFDDYLDCVTLSATLVAFDECGNWSYKELTGKNIIDNVAPHVEIWLKEPDMPEGCTYGATFLTFGWLALDNCLEDVWIVTNYPRIPCGSELYERPKGTYVYDPETIPGATYDATHTEGRHGFEGEFTFCLPYVDCDEFEITIYAVDGQECTDVSTDTLSVFIDNKPPEIITFDTDLTDDCNTATSTVIEWSVTDGSYDYINGYDIGSIEVSHGYLYTTGSTDTEMDISTVSGTVTWNLEGLNHVTVTATLTVWDICCDNTLGGVVSAPPLTYLVDNVKPEATLGFDDDNFAGCGATSTVLTWSASDMWDTTEGTGCLDRVIIELSHGTIDGMNPWVKTFSATSTAEGTVTWVFGPVSGETVAATITAVDCCGNKSEYGTNTSVEAYVRNTGPYMTYYRFDAINDLIIIDFSEVVYTDEATATLYLWDESVTKWVKRAEYSGSEGNVGISTPLSDKRVVHIDAEKTQAGSPVDINVTTKYKLELWSVYSSDSECENTKFYSEPMPIVFDGFGTTYSPGF